LEYAVKKHIEFLGLPGSGKTTLAFELRGYLNSHGHKALSAEQALYAALRRRSHYYELRYPIKYCSYERGKRWLYEVYRKPRFSYDPLNRFLGGHEKMAETLCAIQQYPQSMYNSAVLIRWLVRLYCGYQLAKENLKRNELLVLDEGFCNRAISIFGYCSGTVNCPKLQDYIKNVPAPDAVLRVEASLETREKRLSGRGYPARLKNLDEMQRKELNRNFETCASLVVAGLEARGVPVITINNDGPLERSTEDAGNLLARIFNTPDNLSP
jgi:thymidylate kinase